MWELCRAKSQSDDNFCSKCGRKTLDCLFVHEVATFHNALVGSSEYLKTSIGLHSSEVFACNKAAGVYVCKVNQVDNDRFDYDYNFNFKNCATTQDCIKAFKILLDDDDIADVKDYLKDLPFYQDEITDEILELVFGDKDIDDKFYYKLREIEDLTKTIMGEKYYNFFTRDFIEKFLGE